MKSGLIANRKPKAGQIVLPHDLDAEKWVLGSIALEASVLGSVLEILKPSDFFNDAHRIMMKHLMWFVAEGIRVDLTLLVDRLKESGDYEACGGSAKLIEAIDGVPHHGNAIYYAEIVAKHARRRELVQFATNLQKEASEGTEPDDIDILIDRFRESRPGSKNEISYRCSKGTEIASKSTSVEYIIEDIYVAGQPMIIGGGKKNLKTNTLLDFGVSVTTGSPFLNKFRVNRSVRAVIMTGESGETVVDETLQRIARAKGVELNDNLVVFYDLPRIEDPRHQRALRRLLREHRPEVIILDPAYLVMSGDDAGNLFKTGAVLQLINDLCRGEGATLILAHHTTKRKSHAKGADQFQPPELDDLSWSGFQEFARQWILYGRRAAYDPENPGHHELWLSAGGSAGHSSLWALTIEEGLRSDPGGRQWAVALNPPAVARQNSQRNMEERREAQRNSKHQERVDEARKAIERAMISLPNNEGSRTEIAARAGKRGVAFDDAWGELLRAGKLVECRIAKSNGHKYMGYRWAFDKKRWLDGMSFADITPATNRLAIVPRFGNPDFVR